MPGERDEEQAAVDDAIARELPAATRDAAEEHGQIQKVTREDDLDG